MGLQTSIILDTNNQHSLIKALLFMIHVQAAVSQMKVFTTQVNCSYMLHIILYYILSCQQVLVKCLLLPLPLVLSHHIVSSVGD